MDEPASDEIKIIVMNQSDKICEEKLSPSSDSIKFSDGAAYHAGGCVLTLDILDKSIGTFLAVGGHAKGHGDTQRFGETKAGRNTIQILSLQISPDGQIEKFRLAFAIIHYFGTVRHLHWSADVPTAGNTGRLGACFGNGSFHVFDVPAIAVDNAPSFEKLLPIFSVVEKQEYFQRIQWSPMLHNQLLLGSNTGSITLWDASSPRNQSFPMRTFATSTHYPLKENKTVHIIVAGMMSRSHHTGWLAVRSLSWSSTNKYMFASVGQDHRIRLWDVRSPYSCIKVFRAPYSDILTSIRWIGDDILFAGDSNVIGHLSILNGSIIPLHRLPTTDMTIWDLTEIGLANKNKSLPHVTAVCGNDGTVQLVEVPMTPNTRHHENVSWKVLKGTCDSNSSVTLDTAITRSQKMTDSLVPEILRFRSIVRLAKGNQDIVVTGGSRGVVICQTLGHLDDKVSMSNKVKRKKCNSKVFGPKRPRGRPRKRRRSSEDFV